MRKVLGQAMAMQRATLKQGKKINVWVGLMWVGGTWGVGVGFYKRAIHGFPSPWQHAASV